MYTVNPSHIRSYLSLITWPLNLSPVPPPLASVQLFVNSAGSLLDNDGENVQNTTAKHASSSPLCLWATPLVLSRGGVCGFSVAPWCRAGVCVWPFSTVHLLPEAVRVNNSGFLVKLLGWIISLFSYLQCFWGHICVFNKTLSLCYLGYICYFYDNWWKSSWCGFDI